MMMLAILWLVAFYVFLELAERAPALD